MQGSRAGGHGDEEIGQRDREVREGLVGEGLGRLAWPVVEQRALVGYPPRKCPEVGESRFCRVRKENVSNPPAEFPLSADYRRLQLLQSEVPVVPDRPR